MELASPATTQPTMFNHGVTMKNKEIKKIQFGGYVKQDYKFIRSKLRRLEEKELKIKFKK